MRHTHYAPVSILGQPVIDSAKGSNTYTISAATPWYGGKYCDDVLVSQKSCQVTIDVPDIEFQHEKVYAFLRLRVKVQRDVRGPASLC